MPSEADIRSEIARLTASINQHKSETVHSTSYSAPPPRGRGGYRGGRGYNSFYGSSSTYNPARRMNNKYIRPGLEASSSTTTRPASDNSTLVGASSSSESKATAVATAAPTSSTPSGKAIQGSVDGMTDIGLGSTLVSQTPSSKIVNPDGTIDVVIGGVAFESSSRSLVRKDLAKPKPSTTNPPSTTSPYARKAGHLISTSRSYKSKARRGRGRNMTLDNTRKSWSERMAMKKRKYLNKPCPRFTTTGATPLSIFHSERSDISRVNNVFPSTSLYGIPSTLTGTCNRGLTCMYQHDPSKIAICWNFLQGNCANTAETCNLSHDPTPERTPLCVHFLNKGRCTRIGCLFPHVNVGKREGVCRDFAVLGYCEKGYDCDKQHVRECPDFAENGTCSTKGCKLPHVIRANRGRKAAAASAATADNSKINSNSGLPPGVVTDFGPSATEASAVFAEDGHIGDEFISLTFHESEDEEDSSDDGEESDTADDEEEAQGDVGEDEDDGGEGESSS